MHSPHYLDGIFRLFCTGENASHDAQLQRNSGCSFSTSRNNCLFEGDVATSVVTVGTVLKIVDISSKLQPALHID
jgi:hypothetical protein